MDDQMLHGIGIDSVDPGAQAHWWGGVFGVPPAPEAGEDWWTITGAGPDDVLTLDFAPVPEPRTVPNRVRWAVVGRVDDFMARGATHLWDADGWTVLADPEGNEFCVFERD
ncbi:MAG: VOC family protein [Nocardioides sp.]